MDENLKREFADALSRVQDIAVDLAKIGTDEGPWAHAQRWEFLAATMLLAKWLAGEAPDNEVELAENVSSDVAALMLKKDQEDGNESTRH